MNFKNSLIIKKFLSLLDKKAFNKGEVFFWIDFEKDINNIRPGSLQKQPKLAPPTVRQSTA